MRLLLLQTVRMKQLNVSHPGIELGGRPKKPLATVNVELWCVEEVTKEATPAFRGSSGLIRISIMLPPSGGEWVPAQHWPCIGGSLWVVRASRASSRAPSIVASSPSRPGHPGMLQTLPQAPRMCAPMPTVGCGRLSGNLNPPPWRHRTSCSASFAGIPRGLLCTATVWGVELGVTE